MLKKYKYPIIGSLIALVIVLFNFVFEYWFHDFSTKNPVLGISLMILTLPVTVIKVMLIYISGCVSFSPQGDSMSPTCINIVMPAITYISYILLICIGFLIGLIIKRRK